MSELPAVVGLCPVHHDEFWTPHGGPCPVPGCEEALVEYARLQASSPRQVADLIAAAAVVYPDRPPWTVTEAIAFAIELAATDVAEDAEFIRRHERMHVPALAFAMTLSQPARSGTLRALELVPPHRAPSISTSSDSPWVTVDQPPGAALVVWKATGQVYQCDEHGRVGEDPVA